MPHANVELLTRFYEGFSKLDAAPMRAIYAPDAHFSDPAFPNLRGADIGAMWTMLSQTAKEFRLEFRDVQADDRFGTVHWEAWYRFGGKRPVHNIIDAKFTFENGLVTRHIDEFDFWRWSRQALGAPGLLFGWAPFLKKEVNKRAADSLEQWKAKQPK